MSTSPTMSKAEEPGGTDENGSGSKSSDKAQVKSDSPEESTAKKKIATSNKKKNAGSENKGGPSLPPSVFGRKGDPRMHRAVAARQADPTMSLLDALRAGGFEFPDLENGGGGDKVLAQRKNQLSRRLRIARQQAAQAAEYKKRKARRKKPRQTPTLEPPLTEKSSGTSGGESIDYSSTGGGSNAYSQYIERWLGKVKDGNIIV